MNVQAAWRRRPMALRGTYWLCPHCGAASLVRRLRCAACGDPLRGERRLERLTGPRRVRCWSHSHIQIERLDQRGVLRGAVLVDGPDDRPMAWPLCADDLSFGDDLRNSDVELQLRRQGHEDAPEAPLAYLMKARLGAAARARILSHRNREPSPSRDER
jgi:uncharacterized OB-fold protein